MPKSRRLITRRRLLGLGLVAAGGAGTYFVLRARARRARERKREAEGIKRKPERVPDIIKRARIRPPPEVAARVERVCGFETKAEREEFWQKVEKWTKQSSCRK